MMKKYKKSEQPTFEVLEIHKIKFQGHIIPGSWYKEIQKSNKTPDLIAITLLSDIVFWYRPTEMNDLKDDDGTRLLKKKFSGDLLQRSYKQIAEIFFLTESQARNALVHLEKRGLIKRVFLRISTYQGDLFNVMHIKIFPNRINDITYSMNEVVPNLIPSNSLKNNTNTYVTAESSSEDKDIIDSHLEMTAPSLVRKNKTWKLSHEAKELFQFANSKKTRELIEENTGWEILELTETQLNSNRVADYNYVVKHFGLKKCLDSFMELIEEYGTTFEGLLGTYDNVIQPFKIWMCEGKPTYQT